MKVKIIIEPAEFNLTVFENIKKLFEGKRVTITIAAEMDETGYLCANPANKQYLLDSIELEPSVHFTPEEFASCVKALSKFS